MRPEDNKKKTKEAKIKIRCIDEKGKVVWLSPHVADNPLRLKTLGLKKADIKKPAEKTADSKPIDNNEKQKE